MKTEVAQQLSNQLSDILGQLDGSVRLVMENCTEEEFHSFREGIGKVMGALVLDVMEPLYATNPEVKPADYA
jgi:hypothetical protein